MSPLPASSIVTKVLAVALVVLLAGAGYGGYHYYRFRTKTATTTADLQKQIVGLQETLTQSQHDNADLTEALGREQKKNAAFADQIKDISGTVGTLKKLSETDPQLLQKYSKVYFLNENYVPAHLANIPSDDLSNPKNTLQFHAEALPRLEDLIDDAKDDDIDLQVLSAYRSFYQQASLKSSYKITYGSGANAFSADQGYSEHQLGTAVDFTVPSLGGGLTGFDKTAAYPWLLENAYRYGFIISYPQGNKFYQFEPWHWRFVGEDLARTLHRNKQYFYDMDQRQIDTYLINLFD